MIRRVSFIRRRPGMTPDEFHAHWMGRHAEIVRDLPGLKGLRFNRVQRAIPEGVDWDGVGETWFDTLADADRAFTSEPHKTLLAEDRVKFIGQSQSCYFEEQPGALPPDEASWR